MATDFLVRKDDLRQTKFVDAPAAADVELADGQALLAVDKFAFTANNVTYGAVGEMIGYWQFFPAEEGWGRIPVWGFADVARSRAAGLAEGTRVYGYLPMSTHFVVEPASIDERGFTDASAHRAALPAVYNQYRATAGDPVYDEALEAEQCLLWPLFMTAFLIDDFLDDNGFFGAEVVILSSASSKTAFGLAALLSKNRRDQVSVIGLTSPGNVSFVENLGCYDAVVTYDDIETLRAEERVAYVDMAGNGSVRARLHRHFGDNMKHSSMVGVTHWEHGEGEDELPGAAPEFFFAPSRIEKRAEDWGPAGMQERIGASWRGMLETTAGWIEVSDGLGNADVEKVYLDTVEGRAEASRGYMLSLRED